MTEPTLSKRLTHTRTRLGMTLPEMAAYLGVPVHTLRKWETGERQSSAVLIKLLDVLGLIEALAPAIHDSLKGQHDDDKTKDPIQETNAT